MWDGVSMAGAVAASTSRIKVGTWVLSAFHRNPGIIAKTAETLDEISGGRFVFGLGAGHVWPGQAHAFGLPEDRIFARFEEALQVIVPLLRTGHADFEGEFHAARDLPQRPVGPRPNAIPLLIGGNGPRGQRACGPARGHLERLHRRAGPHGRDVAAARGPRRDLRRARPRSGQHRARRRHLGQPAAAGRLARLGPVRSAEAIADGMRSFRDAGFSQVDLMLGPGTVEAFEAMAPVLELLRAD